MKEIFKPVEGFPNYHISNTGRLRKTTRNGFKYFTGSPSTGTTHTQYMKMNLSADGKSKTVMAHRLVAQAFLPNPDNKPMVNHKDFNGLNNTVDNLEWVTAAENMQHSADNRDAKRTVKLEGNIAGLNARLYQTFLQYQEHIGSIFHGRVCTGLTYKVLGTNPDGTLVTKWIAVTSCVNCGAESNTDFPSLLNKPLKCKNCSRLSNIKDIIKNKENKLKI